MEGLEARLAALEAEVRGGVSLARAIESSEVNVVFDTLSGCVDMRSRARFERFFVLTERHLACCAEGRPRPGLERRRRPSYSGAP